MRLVSPVYVCVSVSVHAEKRIEKGIRGDEWLFDICYDWAADDLAVFSR